VRLIVEKEREIQDFNPKESFKSHAIFTTKDGKKIKSQLQKNFDDKQSALSFLKKNINSNYHIDSVEKKPGKKSPTAPFTTSTLQQEASRKLYFSVSKTMVVAQRLYESGLITYMRTDSVNLSKEAQNSAVNEIKSRYGSEYVQQRTFKNKNKGAQEAHEAIRPTDLSKNTIEGDYDQIRLYELIWKRTISSQMSDAKSERTQLKIKSSNYNEIFIANGEVLLFEGFLKVYLEGTDEELEEDQGILPKIIKDETLNLAELNSIQRFSRPPSRFSEAALVKRLEELGIGRPSTYAPTISTVQNRGYVSKGIDEGLERKYTHLTFINNNIGEKVLSEKTGSNKGKLIPTDIGKIVNDFLVNNFKNILDYNFTAEVEQSFDRIADGDEKWRSMLKTFYSEFHNVVDHVKENAQRESGERILGDHPQNGRVVKVRLGKFGPLAQIGNMDDDDKPQYASLGPDQKLETITLDEVMILFQLPKDLGEYEGEIITVNNGRFGPYVKFGKLFVSLTKGMIASEVDYQTAVELIEEKKKADAPIYEYDKMPVTKGKGRFGPFIKWNNLFINVNKNYDFDNLNDSDIIKLIEEKIQKEKDKVISNWEEEGIKIEKARWGRSNIIKGKLKIELPKTVDASKISLQEAQDRLAAIKSKKKKATSKKK
jgi:DNA topoisomerase-1